MCVPDVPWSMIPGLCVPEKPIALVQYDTCWPNEGPGAGMAADAAPADSRTVPTARVVVRRMRTGFMVNPSVAVNVPGRSAGPMVVISVPSRILRRLPL